MGKFWGSTEKFEYRYTTTNLPLCNDAITVTKIHCFIVFPLSQTSSFQKRDKQTEKKHYTFWSTAGARPTSPTILGMVIEEVRPIFAPTYFF